MRALRNKIGREAGLGSCYRCGDSWSWKDSHSTEYMDGRGCFPLCEECWQALTPEERLPFYEALWSEWQRQFAMVTSPTARADIERDYGQQVHTAIIEAVLAGK